MCSLEQFKIDLKAVTDGETPFQYELDNQFFAALDDAEIQEGSLHVSGSIRKTTGFYEFQLCISGTVQIPCDRCLEMMAQPIETESHFTAKLKENEDSSEQDDIIMVSENEGVLDISWLIYEAIALVVPIQHVHQPGDCNDAMMRVLTEHSAARSSDADANNKEIDPRWSALKDLKF